MKYSCDMIRDLLSLYYDNVCSADSRAAVEEHLEECSQCRGELKKLGDHTYTDSLRQEQSVLIEAYRKGTRKKALFVLSVIFAIPVLTCFIVNIAVGHTLDWFFIVLASLAVLGSLVLVPLGADSKRFMWTFLSFTAALVFLLFICCVYSGGNWFPVAAVSVIFGLSVTFLPFAAKQIPIKGSLERHKGLLVMLTDTALLALLLLICVERESMSMAFSIMGYCIVLPWVLFLTIRYLKSNGLIKAGICCAFTGVFVSLADCVTDLIVNGELTCTNGFWTADLAVWGYDNSANVMLIILLSGVVPGVLLTVCGIIRERKFKNKNK